MKLLRFFASVPFGVALLGIVFANVLCGTIAQGFWGTQIVQDTLFSQFFFSFGSIWFPGIPFWLVFCCVNLVLSLAMQFPLPVKNWGQWIVHVSLILFCLGGIASSSLKDEYSLGLPVGSSSHQAFVKNSPNNELRDLPFQIAVLDFQIRYYPQSQIPQDYESRVHVTNDSLDETVTLKMNQPLRVADYTVYQSSIETVSQRPAPVFKLVRNPWGFFPYLSMAILALGLLTMTITRATHQKTAHLA